MDFGQIIGLISTIATVVGGVFLAYIAYKQRSMDVKLELAKLAAEAAKAAADVAKVEAAKAARQGRRNGARTKALAVKSDEQTKTLDTQTQMMEEAGGTMKQLEHNTNGLLQAANKEAHRLGRQEGQALEKADQAEETAQELARVKSHIEMKRLEVEAAKAAKSDKPQEMIVVNPPHDPIPVEQIKPAK